MYTSKAEFLLATWLNDQDGVRTLMIMGVLAVIFAWAYILHVGRTVPHTEVYRGVERRRRDRSPSTFTCSHCRQVSSFRRTDGIKASVIGITVKTTCDHCNALNTVRTAERA